MLFKIEVLNITVIKLIFLVLKYTFMQTVS